MLYPDLPPCNFTSKYTCCHELDLRTMRFHRYSWRPDLPSRLILSDYDDVGNWKKNVVGLPRVMTFFRWSSRKIFEAQWLKKHPKKGLCFVNKTLVCSPLMLPISMVINGGVEGELSIEIIANQTKLGGIMITCLQAVENSLLSRHQG